MATRRRRLAEFAVHSTERLLHRLGPIARALSVGFVLLALIAPAIGYAFAMACPFDWEAESGPCGFDGEDWFWGALVVSGVSGYVAILFIVPASALLAARRRMARMQILMAPRLQGIKDWWASGVISEKDYRRLSDTVLRSINGTLPGEGRWSAGAILAGWGVVLAIPSVLAILVSASLAGAPFALFAIGGILGLVICIAMAACGIWAWTQGRRTARDELARLDEDESIALQWHRRRSRA